MRGLARMLRFRTLCLFVLAAVLPGAPVLAEQALGPVSGQPVPRFVSLKASQTNLREGPSRDHRIAWVFKRAGEPKKRVVIPGIAHYGIYGVAREQATDLAIEWLDRHLKGSM